MGRFQEQLMINRPRSAARHHLNYQKLESRQLLTTVSIGDVAGRQTLIIDGDAAQNVALVADHDSNQVRVVADGDVQFFNKSEFERIRFLGRSGNDLFENQTDIDSAAFGHGGNDTLIGGNGHNWIQGGDGNDTIVGGDKNDQLRGRNGNDMIDGGKRHDRIFGGNGTDEIVGRSGDDFIMGEAGNDFIYAMNGADRIEGGSGSDTIYSGQGNDQVVLSANYSNYTVAGESSLFISANSGGDGNDRVYGSELLKFANITLNSQDALTAVERVIVRPIVVSDTGGGNTAEFFGNQEQENDIKDLIDNIFSQADVDIFWQTEQAWHNTFANVGNGGTRPTSDLQTIVENGDALGIGSPDPKVVDLYFVEIAPGFDDLGENYANGLAFLNASGVAVHVGDNLVSFDAGREIISRVVAHEISHNLGLEHINVSGNLMNENANGIHLTTAQIEQILDSSMTQPI